ncbi:hypothetical protein BC832DRAFT_17283 [Gaertneriomyces semiglobifer]|nr:hypothetical protein BC832DRAFT_17283 [Gaertneriomyces semiglobifer]
MQAQSQPEALPPTPQKRDDEERRNAVQEYATDYGPGAPPGQMTSEQAEHAAAAAAASQRGGYPFFYQTSMGQLPPGFPANLLTVQQPSTTGVGGAFPLLVAAAVAAQPAPLQNGSAPPTQGGDEHGSGSQVKRRRRATKFYHCQYPGCTRAFTRHFNLQTHAKTHDPNRDKPFMCEVCQKAFGRKVDRDRHHNGKFALRPLVTTKC